MGIAERDIFIARYVPFIVLYIVLSVTACACFQWIYIGKIRIESILAGSLATILLVLTIINITEIFDDKIIGAIVSMVASLLIMFFSGCIIPLSFLLDNIEKISKHKTKIYILSILSIIVVFLYGVIYSNIIGKFYSSNFNYNTIFFMISLLGLFVATMNYKGKNKIIKNIINYIGKNSLGIYFIHIIVSKALAPLVSFTSIGLTLLYGLFVLAISTVITYIISKIPVIKKLIKI